MKRKSIIHALKAVQWITLTLLIFVLSASSSQALRYAENCKDAEIIMTDLKWLFWPEFTDSADWNVGVKGEGGVSFSFYGGYVSHIEKLGPNNEPAVDPETQSLHKPGSVWSFSRKTRRCISALRSQT